MIVLGKLVYGLKEILQEDINRRINHATLTELDAGFQRFDGKGHLGDAQW